MPTKTYYRKWCKKCNAFELHSTKWNEGSNSTFQCVVCDTEYSNILLKDIPEDKLIEQRKRYSDAKRLTDEKYLNMFLQGGYGGLGGNPLEDLFREDIEPEIRESDAGQKHIDDEKRKEQEAVRAIRREQRAKDLELVAKYTKLGRNDICICGSGKKYKKCCLAKITEIENKRR